MSLSRRRLRVPVPAMLDIWGRGRPITIFLLARLIGPTRTTRTKVAQPPSGIGPNALRTGGSEDSRRAL